VSAAVHLYVDTTALLTIHQLGLLDILDAAGLSLTFATPCFRCFKPWQSRFDSNNRAGLRFSSCSRRRWRVRRADFGPMQWSHQPWPLWSSNQARHTDAAGRLRDPVRPEITLGAVAGVSAAGGITAERVIEIRATYSGWQSVAQTIDPPRLTRCV